MTLATPRIHALLLGLITLIANALAPLAGATLEVAAVTREQVEREYLQDGTVEATQQSTVSAQTAGRVAELPYDVDDLVPAGALVARFTDVEQRAAAGRAEAALREAEAAAVETRADLARVTELQSRGVMARAELDRAVARNESARARVASASAALDAAREQLAYTEVRAPYAGIVTERHVAVGESVSPGQPLLTGLSTDRLRVVVDLPQALAASVREQGRALVLIDGEQSTGVVAESVVVFPYADARSRTFRVRVALPPGVVGLYPGMFVKVAFPAGPAERLLVPSTALVKRGEVTGVYVVDESGEVRLRQVRIGRRYGASHEVLAGLVAGEQVATDPVRAGAVLKTATADGR